MSFQPLEKLLPQSGFSVYKLVLMAAKRATELADGSPKLVDFPSSPKTTTIAIDEIANNRVMLTTIAEGRVVAGKSKGKKKE